MVWIDAHADIHSPYTSPSGNIHGMPLAVCLNEDNLDCQVNQITNQLLHLIACLCKTAGITGHPTLAQRGRFHKETIIIENPAFNV